MLKNRSRTAVVASQSGKNNIASSDRMQLGSYQIPRLVEQRHSISSTAVQDVDDGAYVDDHVASIVNGCRNETGNNLGVNRHPSPSNVPYFSLTFLNPANENCNPHAPEKSTIVQNDRRDEDVTMMNTKMENLQTHEVVSEFSNEIMNAIDCNRSFGRDITNQISSTSARKRSRTTIDGTSLNLKSSETDSSPPKKLGRPPRERTNKENAIDGMPYFNLKNVENQLPKTTNESFQTPTVTNVPKKRARGRTSKKSGGEKTSESPNSSSNLKTPGSRSRKAAKFFDGTPKIVFPSKKSKESKESESATRKSLVKIRTTQINDDDKVAGAVFSNSSRSRTSVTKTPITKANAEVSKGNASTLNRSRTVPNRARTRTTKSTIEYNPLPPFSNTFPFLSFPFPAL